MLRPSIVAALWAGLSISLSGQFVSTTNTGLGQLESLAVDPQGNRYVCDRTGNRVMKLDADNTPTVYSGSGLSLPTGLVRMPTGELYVANHTAGTISVIPPGGGPATVYASGFSAPRGIAADAQGNLYVGEYFSQRILKVAPGGAWTVVVGNAGITGTLGGNDRLEHLAIEPSGNLIATIGFSSPGRVYRIALPAATPTLLASSPLLAGSFAINVNQSTGNIYITGVTGHRILSLTPQGAVSVVTGDGIDATLDGPLALARFSEPSGITVDPDGNIWISQFGGAVRRIGLQAAEVPTNGLRLWLRADRGLLRNGSTVTQWLDQSGSANHAAPTGVISTPAAPQFVSGVVNGYPAVRFNGVSTGLTTPAFQTFPSKRGTIFSVVRVAAPSSTSGQGYGTIAGTYYAASGTTWQFGSFPGQYAFYDGVGTSNFNVAANPPNVWGIATFMRDSDNSFQFFKSGISVGGGSLADNQPSPLPVHIGWNDYISPAAWEVLNGDIAELIIYDGALSPAELEQVHAYLADKYAFNGDVPLPAAQGATICESESATLSASGGDAYRWYDSPEATVPLATTASFTTPVLTATTTYYVANFNGQLQSQRVPVTVTVLQIGASCDDGDPNTINDVLQAGCVCAGTPVNTCTTDLDFVYRADGQDALTWELREQGTNNLMQSGGGMLMGDGLETTCLPDGCFYLVVTDGGGDGIAGGGYLLRTSTGLRLIDDRMDAFGNGGFSSGATSQIDGGEGFCLPVGADRLIFTSCDRMDWRVSCKPEYIVANDNAAVTAQYGVNNATSGYQMWWFDPNGGYSYKRFQSHSTANGMPASATRACHFLLNNGWGANSLQEGGFYNVKVRGRVNGTYLPWGPACRMAVNSTLAQCPRTKLVDIPDSPFLSCGQTRGIGQNIRVHAIPVHRMNAGCTGKINANRYQFRFRIDAENFLLVKTSLTGQYFVNTLGLQCGKTYDVDVRASFDNGATWCHAGPLWGDMCQITTTCNVNGMALEGGQEAAAGEVRMSMHPNPNRGDELFLGLSGLGAGVQAAVVDIYDSFGKRVASRTLGVQDGFVSTVLSLDGTLANGMYLVSITAGQQAFTQRLVIRK